MKRSPVADIEHAMPGTTTELAAACVGGPAANAGRNRNVCLSRLGCAAAR